MPVVHSGLIFNVQQGQQPDPSGGAGLVDLQREAGTYNSLPLGFLR